MSANLPFLRRPALATLAAVAAALALVVTVALPRLERLFLIRAGEESQATLALTLEALRSELDRAEPLPALLAERPDHARLLADPSDEALATRVNEQLHHAALGLGVSDIYLMDREGLTVAASNYRRADSFVGQNFAYRPYFTSALNGGSGRFHALGTTSGQRGYFFSAPVEADGRIVGVMVVKVTLDRLEATWTGASVVVVDGSGVIFLSDREDWRFRTLGGITGASIERIVETRQYPLDRLRPLGAERRTLGRDSDILTVGGDAPEAYVAVTGLLARAGWRVTILTPTGPALTQARLTAAMIALLILSLGLVAMAMLERRARLLERLEVQAQAQAMLEARVAERTIALRQEVAERTAAEERLRATQKELVQAGKLAALGQMSAALSHEFNQPLAAVKAYADNAATFLDRDQAEEARRNIGLISQMADRMASISRHLRNFARRPQDKTGPIALLATIDEAIALMRPRIEAAGAQLRYDRPEGEIEVIGGRVRLQQVLVNLMSNALDAMERVADPAMELSVEPSGDGWRVALRDHGPGIGRGVEDRIFDPFFSTKGPGKGMGLGLSISYNILRDFGGRLSAWTHPAGGAVFAADLVAAPAQEVAAE
ncbi:sensor histidine kinase [Rhodobacterales bacterium HKCCE2091]|nr:sensor histidine kinase [Rhodobacterales bacterium HKCCE2091]